LLRYKSTVFTSCRFYLIAIERIAGYPPDFNDWNTSMTTTGAGLVGERDNGEDFPEEKEGIMYRLFVAIDLPDETKDEIAKMVDGQLAGARWLLREQLHLTLRFIGDADDRLFQEIKTGLEGVKARPFPLILKGVGHFPPKREPRVLWVGIEGSEQLNSLQTGIEREIVNAGIEAEMRSFSPHVTIARLRNTPPAKIAQLEEKHRHFRSGPFPVEGFYLYTSIMTREGATHRREATYRL
jgi:RNA 2',3'-cyclic 3'-phosphodiesterase